MTKSQNSEIAVLQTEVKNMSKDLTEVKNHLLSLIKKVDDLTIAQTEISELRTEVTYLKKEITQLKGVNNLKNTLLWVGLVASAIINVVALYNIFGGGK